MLLLILIVLEIHQYSQCFLLMIIQNLDFFYKLISQKKLRLHFNEFMLNFHDFVHENKNKGDENIIDLFVKNLKSKIEYLSEKLRLEEIINKITGELSSGQRNRVSLAKSIINDPLVLLLDEPTASLDPETGDFVRSFIEKISKEKNMSILLASHNMDEVKRLCKNVLMMNNGVIIDQGTPDNLIKKHGKRNLEEVFLKLNRNNNES